jgi:hypothetical protein
LVSDRESDFNLETTGVLARSRAQHASVQANPLAQRAQNVSVRSIRALTVVANFDQYVVLAVQD